MFVCSKIKVFQVRAFMCVAKRSASLLWLVHLEPYSFFGFATYSRHSQSG